MNYLKEIYKQFSKNMLLIIMHTVFISILLFLINTTIQFTRDYNAPFREAVFYEVYDGKEIYTMADDLFGDEYSAFRETSESAKRMARFHDTLKQQESFLFMSRMSTNIPVHTINECEEQMNINEYNYERQMYAFFMNENLFNFYSLETQNYTQQISWQKVEYNSGRIPVFLGSGYEEMYKVGDVIHAEVFFLEQELEIVGFLLDSTTIYYQYNFTYSLDDYIIIPYPPNLLNLFEAGIEESTISTLAFFMLNADIIVDRVQGYTINSLIEMIGSIAREIGYEHYVFMGVPIRISKLASMVSLIYRTKTEISLILIFAVTLTLLLHIYATKIYFDRSKQTYLTYLHNGVDVKFIFHLSAFDTGIPLVLSFLLSFYFLERVYRIEWVPVWAFFIFAYHYINILIIGIFFIISYYYIRRKVKNL